MHAVVSSTINVRWLRDALERMVSDVRWRWNGAKANCGLNRHPRVISDRLLRPRTTRLKSFIYYQTVSAAVTRASGRIVTAAAALRTYQ